MEHHIKVSGRMMLKMGMDKKSGLTNQNIMVNTKKDSSMEKVTFFLLMEVATKETGSTI